MIFATAAATDPGSLLMTVGPLILMFVVFYFFLIRPQRKKEKATTEMRKNIAVGDEVVTIGGIAGKVLSLKEDSVVLEVGSDKTKLRVMRWAVQSREEKITN